MNKIDLIKNFKNYTPEQIAEAIKSGVVSSYELLHETGGAYTPLLRRKVNQALQQIEMASTNQNEEYPVDDPKSIIKEEKEETQMLKIPSVESHVISESPIPKTNTTETDNVLPVNESKKSMFKPFSFNGRIHRTEYGISMIICVFIQFGLNAIVTAASYGLSNPTGLLVLYFILLVPYLWFMWAQGAKRCHDRGNSGWYQMIPFYGFWLLFAAGNLEANKYGVSPK